MWNRLAWTTILCLVLKNVGEKERGPAHHRVGITRPSSFDLFCSFLSNCPTDYRWSPQGTHLKSAQKGSSKYTPAGGLGKRAILSPLMPFPGKPKKGPVKTGPDQNQRNRVEYGFRPL
jgi:hypothetical protein